MCVCVCCCCCVARTHSTSSVGELRVSQLIRRTATGLTASSILTAAAAATLRWAAAAAAGDANDQRPTLSESHCWAIIWTQNARAQLYVNQLARKTDRPTSRLSGGAAKVAAPTAMTMSKGFVATELRHFGATESQKNERTNERVCSDAHRTDSTGLSLDTRADERTHKLARKLLGAHKSVGQVRFVRTLATHTHTQVATSARAPLCVSTSRRQVRLRRLLTRVDSAG